MLFRAGLDRGLEAICLKMLARQPDDRYESMEAVAEDLRRFLAGETTLARPAGRIESAWKWMKRRPTLTTLIVVLAIGLPIAFRLASWALDKQSTAIVAEREIARTLYAQALIEGERNDAGVVLSRLADALEAAVAGGDAELETSIRRQLGAW